MIEIYILLILMIIGAVIAIEAKDLLSSVVSVGAVGLFLSMTFLVLKAPDVAIMQLVVELLALVILIRATLKKDLPFSASGRWFLNTLITAVFIAVFLFIVSGVIKDLPEFGYPIMKVASFYIKEGFKGTGATNIVSSIVLDYRAFDALGEVTVLFAAVVGVLSIVRRSGRREEGALELEEEDEI